MSQLSSVTEWIDRLRQGDDEAARRVWKTYYDRLVRLARDQLRTLPRRVADEEDVVAGVFTSLFEALRQGRYPDLNDRTDLWRMLLAFTENRVIDHARYEKAQKRGGGLVRGDSAFAASPGGAAEGFDQMAADEPTPDFALRMAEQVEHLLALLDAEPSKKLRQVALWKLEGCTDQEIADRLGCVTKTVERKVKAIRAIWNQGAE